MLIHKRKESIMVKQLEILSLRIVLYSDGGRSYGTELS